MLILKSLKKYLLLALAFISVCGFSGEAKILFLDQAIVETLKHRWDIFISEMSYLESSGRYQSSKGPFDPVWTLSGSHTWSDTWSVQEGLDLGEDNVFANLPLVGTWRSQEPGGVKVGVAKDKITSSFGKLTHFGTRYQLTVDSDRTLNPLFILNDPFAEVYATDLIPYIRRGTGEITLEVSQPLLKGFLANERAMNEKSLEFEAEARKHEFLQNVSKQVLGTINAYWGLVEAQQKEAAYRDDANQYATFVYDTKELVKTQQVAKAQLSQAQRSYLSAKANVTEAKQEIVRAAQELSLAMGAPEKFKEYCGSNLLLEDYPLANLTDFLDCSSQVASTAAFATKNREDLIALKLFVKAASMKKDGAFNETFPTFDIELKGTEKNTGYENGAKSVFKAMNFKVPERSAKVGLQFRLPIKRDEGKGFYKTAKGLKKQTEYEYEKQKSRVFSAAVDAMNRHNTLIKEVKEVGKALAQAKIYVEEQKILIKSGQTSLFELLQSQEKKIFQTIRFIEVRTRYNQNLANLYFILGILVTQDQDFKSFKVSNTSHLPDFLLDPIVRSN